MYNLLCIFVRWDTRNMNEPTDTMIIDLVKTATDTQNIDNALGVSALEYEPTIPTRFMVGTENGLIIGGNRKGKNALEKLPSKVSIFLYTNIITYQKNQQFYFNFVVFYLIVEYLHIFSSMKLI